MIIKIKCKYFNNFGMKYILSLFILKRECSRSERIYCYMLFEKNLNKIEEKENSYVIALMFVWYYTIRNFQ